MKSAIEPLSKLKPSGPTEQQAEEPHSSKKLDDQKSETPSLHQGISDQEEKEKETKSSTSSAESAKRRSWIDTVKQAKLRPNASKL